MIGQLLPAGVVAVETFEDVPGEPVFPGEEDLVANAVEVRRTARRCAREALAKLGYAPVLAERGIDVSYETVRRWVLKFGSIIARKLRRGRPRPDGRWHLDEVFVSINGRQLYVWRAVDSEGEVLDRFIRRSRCRNG
jgi:transposase-like protein